MKQQTIFLVLLAIAISITSQTLIAAEQIIPTKATTDDLPKMQQRSFIRALVTYSKTDFFFYKGRPRGIQVEFLQQYEKWLNKDIKREENKTHIIFIPTTFDQLIPSLIAGKGDIAAAMLTMTPDRKAMINFVSGNVMNVSELLVSHKKAPAIKHLNDLSEKVLYVLKNSSYTEHLKQINQSFKQQKLEPIKIQEADSNLLSEDILELVNSGVRQYTVIDDFKGRLWAKVLPNIQLHENIKISQKNKIGWAVRKDNPLLEKSLNGFAKTVKKGTLLGNMLFNRYYGKVSWIKNPNSEKEREKLDKFINLFKKYGEKYNFDYLALTAQAYQESGLDNSKKSHRGAVGIMQLLPSTAADKNVNITEINQIENNIHAGAKYLAFLRERYFSDPEISPESQFAFSWAAYNAGPGNVRKMRALAKKMGLNPNRWFNHVEMAAGKIIGRETVQYVANIFKYYIAYKLADSESLHL